jgi:hypothetical protein
LNVLVPTPVSLAAQYKHWLENSIIQLYRDKYNQADARLDLAALGAAASQVIESPCTNTLTMEHGYMIHLRQENMPLASS